MSSIRDVLLVTIILFATGISVFFSVDIGHRVNAQLYNVTIINNTLEAKQAITSADNAINMMDYIYFCSFIGLMFGIIITGYFIAGIPILAPIYFFILIVFSFVGIVIQNVWSDMSLNGYIAGEVVNLPLTNFVLSHVGYFTVVVGLVSIVILFGKPSGNSGGGF